MATPHRTNAMEEPQDSKLSPRLEWAWRHRRTCLIGVFVFAGCIMVDPVGTLVPMFLGLYMAIYDRPRRIKVFDTVAHVELCCWCNVPMTHTHRHWPEEITR